MTEITARKTVWVLHRHPGVEAIGPYQQGVAYEVDAAEAKRLVEHKGFQRTKRPTTGDKQ